MVKILAKIRSILTVLGIILPTTFAGCAPHYYYLRPEVKPLSMENIITLTEKGSTDREIIERIDESGTVIFLRTDDILRLHRDGVTNPVIDHLITVKEWTLLSSPGIYTEISPGRIYQVPHADRDFRQPRSLVPISVH